MATIQNLYWSKFNLYAYELYGRDSIGGLTRFAELKASSVPCYFTLLTSSERQVYGKQNIVVTHRLFTAVRKIKSTDIVYFKGNWYSVQYIDRCNRMQHHLELLLLAIKSPQIIENSSSSSITESESSSYSSVTESFSSFSSTSSRSSVSSSSSSSSENYSLESQSSESSSESSESTESSPSSSSIGFSESSESTESSPSSESSSSYSSESSFSSLGYTTSSSSTEQDEYTLVAYALLDINRSDLYWTPLYQRT